MSTSWFILLQCSLCLCVLSTIDLISIWNTPSIYVSTNITNFRAEHAMGWYEQCQYPKEFFNSIVSNGEHARLFGKRIGINREFDPRWYLYVFQKDSRVTWQLIRGFFEYYYFGENEPDQFAVICNVSTLDNEIPVQPSLAIEEIRIQFNASKWNEAVKHLKGREKEMDSTNEQLSNSTNNQISKSEKHVDWVWCAGFSGGTAVIVICSFCLLNALRSWCRKKSKQEAIIIHPSKQKDQTSETTRGEEVIAKPIETTSGKLQAKSTRGQRFMVQQLSEWKSNKMTARASIDNLQDSNDEIFEGCESVNNLNTTDCATNTKYYY